MTQQKRRRTAAVNALILLFFSYFIKLWTDPLCQLLSLVNGQTWECRHESLIKAEPWRFVTDVWAARFCVAFAFSEQHVSGRCLLFSILWTPLALPCGAAAQKISQSQSLITLMFCVIYGLNNWSNLEMTFFSFFSLSASNCCPQRGNRRGRTLWEIDWHVILENMLSLCWTFLSCWLLISTKNPSRCVSVPMFFFHLLCF